MRNGLIAFLFVTVAIPTTAGAQALEGRVGKLESEMRAVQRKVFPGGGTYVEPQVPPSAPVRDDVGAPASSAIDDLTQRVSSLEAQIASMTGQIEQNQYRLRQLEDQFTAYRKATDAKLAAAPVASAPVDAADPVVPPAPRPASSSKPAPASSGIKDPVASTTKDPGRAARVAAVQRPDTAQPDEDDYLYGYRLWAAKLYPEAETQLKKVVADYPRSKRASYAQNLLGRSYLDEGKPNLAATTFYENYKKMPDGERAPDSLYFLGQALIKLNKPADACKVYGELIDVYGDKIGQGMKDDVARARVSAKCK